MLVYWHSQNLQVSSVKHSGTRTGHEQPGDVPQVIHGILIYPQSHAVLDIALSERGVS